MTRSPTRASPEGGSALAQRYAENPWRIMTREEFGALGMKGRYLAEFDYDGAGNVAVWLNGETSQSRATTEQSDRTRDANQSLDILQEGCGSSSADIAPTHSGAGHHDGASLDCPPPTLRCERCGADVGQPCRAKRTSSTAGSGS